ncbi:MAG TPA: ABC transporter permease [Solirubrobacter sp.]|nr:ABC transporter permease [Solirubrobacter sp.]
MSGTWPLTRFVLRRDRVRLTVWVLSITVVVLGSVTSFSTTYPTAADRAARIDVLQGSAAAALFVGPGYGAEDYTFGAMTANELLPLTALVVGLMSIFLVVRHTRAEEEEGRADLVRSAMVGRRAAATAALAEAFGAQLVLCALLAAGLPAALDGLDPAGSLAFASAIAGVGFVFAALALVAAQLTVSARSALGLASVALAALYLLRALADLAGVSALAWLSPFGWASNMRAYVDERWWPLLLFAAATAALVAVAFRILAGRDLGAGIVGDRPARPRAAPWLRSPLALALRLQRTSLIAWGASLFALGAVYGSIATEASKLSGDVVSLRDYYQRIGTGAVVDQFLSVTLSICALVAAGFAIQAAARARGEESAQRVEPVLATPVARARWLGSHLALSLGGGAAMLLAIGIGLGGAYALSSGDAAQLPRLVGAALAYAPAVWVFSGLAALLFGLLPRATAWTWAVFGAVVFVGFLGPLLKLPGWVFDLSPFEHVPTLPAEGFSLLPLLVLTAIAAALAAGGIAAFRRRDIG